MKEIEITNKVKLPTINEIKQVAKNTANIASNAIILYCHIFGNDFESDESKAVFKYMQDSEDFIKNRIANEVVKVYCDENNINFNFIDILKIDEYEKHFAIKALIG